MSLLTHTILWYCVKVQGHLSSVLCIKAKILLSAFHLLVILILACLGLSFSSVSCYSCTVTTKKILLKLSEVCLCHWLQINAFLFLPFPLEQKLHIMLFNWRGDICHSISSGSFGSRGNTMKNDYLNYVPWKRKESVSYCDCLSSVSTSVFILNSNSVFLKSLAIYSNYLLYYKTSTRGGAVTPEPSLLTELLLNKYIIKVPQMSSRCQLSKSDYDDP